LFPETAPDRQVLTVRQLNEEISAAVGRAFPGTVWVRGEVQRLPADAARRTHVYFELHQTGGSGAAEYQVSVSLMGWDRDRFGLGRYLDGTDPDFQLANKMEVCLECKVDFYAKFGKMSLKVVGVDRTFSLGKLEARRREILAWLAGQELLDRNAELVLPDLPLRVGLITSPGSAAERDFQTGLESSPWRFEVTLRGAKMQGEQLEGQIIAALKALLNHTVDVIVITRGGGSRADLSWFDQKALAEAIALSPAPVITAIGHEIDHSIADRVAHHACKTPTAAAEFLADRVEESAIRLEEAARGLRERVQDLLSQARGRIEVGDRVQRAAAAAILRSRLTAQSVAGRVQQRVGQRLSIQGEQLAGQTARLASRAEAQVARAGVKTAELARRTEAVAVTHLSDSTRKTDDLAHRLIREAPRPVESGLKKLDGLAVQARLLDPAALLARGFTMTMGADGRLLKGIEPIAAGDRITTRFADGHVDSIVQPGSGAGTGGSTKTGKGKRTGGKKTKPGQKSLFG
jgi:exodeoxyribonuclease VII large subunit